MPNKPLHSYPLPLGGKYFEVVDLQGPASYSSPQTIRAADFGMGAFDHIQPAGVSLSGTYNVLVVLNTTSGQRGQPMPTATIRWFDSGTGLEVAPGTVLSGEYTRLMLIMI